MAGVLDLLGASTGSAEKDAAINHGLLQAGFALLQSRGRLGPALGQAGMAGLQGFQQYQQNTFQQQLQAAQLEELKRRQLQAKREDEFRQGLPAPGAANPQELTRGAVQAGLAPVGDYISSITPKEKAPIKLGAGDTLVDPTSYKPVASAPEKEPEALRTLGIIYGKDSPQYRKAAQDLATKMTTHTPPVNVQVNTAKPFLNTVAEGLGKQIDTSLGEAKSATAAIGTAHQLLSAIDSGKVVSGPGAKFRIFGLQVGQVLGVGGKDAAEVLGNTRSAIQAMAKGELDGAQQMKNQGQITEAERDIIKRAASGDIESLTTGEMRQLALAMEKTARGKIKQHRGNLERLGKMPEAGPILPFYQIEEPPAYAAPQGSGMPAIDPAAIDAELKRRGVR